MNSLGDVSNHDKARAFSSNTLDFALEHLVAAVGEWNLLNGVVDLYEIRCSEQSKWEKEQKTNKIVGYFLAFA